MRRSRRHGRSLAGRHRQRNHAPATHAGKRFFETFLGRRKIDEETSQSLGIIRDVASCGVDAERFIRGSQVREIEVTSCDISHKTLWLAAAELRSYGTYFVTMVEKQPMGQEMPVAQRPSTGRYEAIDFVLREGQIEIRCSVSYDALRRQAGVAEINGERARRLFNWYRDNLERIALARYAAGDFRDGLVTIDSDDIAVPADWSARPTP